MKKIFLLGVITLLSFGLYAQEHYEGDLTLNLGFGLGSTFGAGDARIPPIGISGELGISDEISVGGFLGYSAFRQTLPFFGAWKYRYLIVAARGSYHHPIIDGVDTYGGAMLGYNAAKATYDGNNTPPSNPASGGLTYSIFIGGRYFFADNLGAFAELGYGISVLQVGVTMKL